MTESEDFRNLESQQVEQWLSSDDLAVSTEDDVLKIIFMWIEENKSERKGKLEQLMRHARLAFVSRDFLETDVVTNSLVKEDSNCLKLVRDAMEGFHCSTNRNLHQPPRNWWHTHIVVLINGRTLYYDVHKEMWYPLQNSPRKFERINVSSFQGKLYVFEKTKRGIFQSFLYDPLFNRWVRLNWDFSQFQPKAVLTAVVRGEMYAVIDNDSSSKTLAQQEEELILKYNVESDSWEHFSSILCDGFVAVSGACTVALDSFLYLLGGCFTYPDSITPTRTASRFNTIDKKWERIADLQEARYNTCGVPARGKIFIAGGIIAGDFPSALVTTDTCEVYNIYTNEWQFIASLYAPRSRASMLCIKGELFVVGGYHWEDGRSNTPHALAVESYDFEWNNWKIVKKKLPRGNLPSGHDMSHDFKACSLRVNKRPFC